MRLAVNLGLERAIAVGLSLVAERSDIDAVLVMDCDGEDRPADITALVAAGLQRIGRISWHGVRGARNRWSSARVTRSTSGCSAP